MADLPPSYHVSEDIHEHSNIDEASLETDIRYIANPDLIALRDVKSFESIDPRLCPFKRSRGLTGTPFDGNPDMLFFYQSGNAAIPNAVFRIHQQVRDTAISIRRIRRS